MLRSLPHNYNRVLVEYAYDAASRITGITYKQNGTTVLGNLTYEYDKAENRTNIGGTWARTGLPQGITTSNYNAANRQLTFGDKTLTYDDNGNLTSIVDGSGTTLYAWNARNQLTGISGPNVTASFVYDGVGRREKKTVNGSLTEFLMDGYNVVQETSGATVLANVLTGLGIDEYFSRSDVPSATIGHFLGDALGSALALTDPTGAVQTEYTYEPFGRTTLTGAANTSSYQYTGRENDGTGLYYHRSRYYHPALQRFVAEDPIEFRGGDINLYGYVGNNPTHFTDPFGLALDDWYGFPSWSEHVNRNRYNRCPARPPHTWQQIRMSGGRYDPDPEQLWTKPWPTLKYRSDIGNECKYGPDGKIMPDAGTYNYGANPRTWDHIWNDIIPHFWYGGSKSYTPGLTTVY